MLPTEQEALHLEFALKEKRFACTQNIADGREVMGILQIGYRKILIYTILPFVIDMLPGKHMFNVDMVLVIGKEDRLHMIGLGAVHMSGNIIDTGK